MVPNRVRDTLLAAALVLALGGGAVAASSGGPRKAGVRPAGRSALASQDLAAIAQRLGLRVARASRSGLAAFPARRPGPGALPPTVSTRRLRAERRLPAGWQLSWRRESDTPAFVRAAPSAAKVASPTAGTPAERALALLQAHPDVFALAHPRDELRHVETVRDGAGRLHVRFDRLEDGVPIWGEDLTVHMDAGGALTAVNGRYSPTPPAAVPAATLSAAAAIARAAQSLAARVVLQGLDATARRLLDYDGPRAERCLLSAAGGALRPAWCVEIRPNLRARWRLFVDAQTGEVVDAYDATPWDGPATAQATDLAGTTRTLNVYQLQGEFALLDASRPMFAATQPDLPGDPRGALVTLSAGGHDLTRTTPIAHVVSADNTWPDPAAVSAHWNMGAVFAYYLGAHGRLSIDGHGGTMYSIVHVTDGGQPMDNAFWSGAFIAYGDGDVAFAPLAEALDVAAHEMTHGVIQHTVNLEYRGQSGALNESFADVFGVMVDRDDWRLGEDVVRSAQLFPSGALRDMADPHNGAAPGSSAWQPAHMDEFVEAPPAEDNGGVHVNSGIPNRACYLIADAIGRGATERIYFHILEARLLSSRGNFVDMRRAAIQSATELFGEGSAQAAAVADAFAAVGIAGDEGYQPPPRRDPMPGERWLLVVNAEGSGDRALYLVRPQIESEEDIVLLTPTQVFDGTGNAVSVAANGAFALFVDGDNNLRAIDIDGTDETVLSATGDWSSIALAPDGTRLAATTIYPDSTIYLIDLADPGRSKAIRLRHPTTQEGVTAGVVLFADALDWDPEGQFLIFDAFNAVPTAAGDSLVFWDVNLLEPEAEYIVPLLPPQPEGLQLGNPSFAHTTGRQVAFDMFDARTDDNEVWVFDLVTGDAGFIAATGSALGFPTFAVDDGELAYEHEDDRGRTVVARIALTDNRLAAAGAAQDFLTDARAPKWLAIAPAQVPTSVGEAASEAEPAALALAAAFPNPCNGTTAIDFELPESAHAELTVYDVRGAVVARLAAGAFAAGRHRATWDGRDTAGRAAASGVYLYRLAVRGVDSAERRATRRLLLVR